MGTHVKKLGDEANVAVWMIRQSARKQIAARGQGSERAFLEATDAAVEEIGACEGEGGGSQFVKRVSSAVELLKRTNKMLRKSP